MDVNSVPIPKDMNDVLLKLLSSPNINSKKYIGMSFGVILIPYQTKQYSSLSLQLGYSHSFGFGGGFDLGIGYRI